MLLINAFVYKIFFIHDCVEGYLHFALRAVFPHNARGQTTIRPHVLCLTTMAIFHCLYLVELSACTLFPDCDGAGKQYFTNMSFEIYHARDFSTRACSNYNIT